MNRIFLRGSLGLVLASVAPVAMAQAKTAGAGVDDTSIFAPLEAPTPNDFRLASGAPGPRYWQNRADYDIRATLDTATKSLRGELTMRYTNNSPTALDHIWMQMDQDAFRPGSLNSYIFAQDSRFGSRDFDGGDKLERFDQVLAGAKGAKPRRVALATRSGETMLYVPLAEPLLPGRTASFEIAWRFLVPEHGADRMGRDGSLYEMAQWYPRVAVYDDVRGWNTDPYLGQGEFYLEYGDFTYAVTVPAGYIVAGTGTLLNPRDVLTPTQISRLAVAAKSDTTLRIVTAKELESGAARPRTSGTLTWRFEAKNVRDVAWTTAPDYQWDASSWKGRMAYAYYRPSAVDTWSDAADEARMSIMEYSERWFTYPYPQISAVEGPVSGMEYPMLAMETVGSDKYDLYNVITHEVGHNWFPMIVGSNERIHFWQDEGFNTFINTFSEARRYPERGDQMKRAAEERGQVETAQIKHIDTPIEVPADRINPGLLGINQYVKTSAGLQLLRQEILGPAVFDAAFKEYINRWAFKHPTPTDFYRTMEDVSGRRLDWFWREWFQRNERFDQAIDTVLTRTSGDTTEVLVAYGNRERGVLPIRARFSFSDHTTADYDYPAEVWSTNTRRYIREYQFVGKALVQIELDPEHRLVDVNRSNNIWRAPGTGGPEMTVNP
ncbi:MAG TPA: M1 family metallopeptidase [Gemmatimonadaceae bacterium]|nr:M1 family metallopeptidase [Gemmatimonadaceae bacterium]